MRSEEERLLQMHARAAEIRRQREQTGIRIAGVLSATLMICLVVVIHQVADAHQALMTGQGTGSSLLAESAGGYVLIAVAAFFTGAIITAAAIRYRSQEGKDQNDSKVK